MILVSTTRLRKKDLGLPHVSAATEAQRAAGMCWATESELYNNGSPFKVTSRAIEGVMVTLPLPILDLVGGRRVRGRRADEPVSRRDVVVDLAGRDERLEPARVMAGSVPLKPPSDITDVPEASSRLAASLALVVAADHV